MASIVVNGDTSGAVTLSAPAVAGTVTVTLPSASGTMAVSGGSPSFTTITTTNDASISGLTVGKGAGSVATNTAVGLNALVANTSGATNTAVGERALYSTTTGSNNTAVGYRTLNTNISGTDNTALGYAALYYNTGNANSAIGTQALFNNTTAVGSTALGYQALYTSNRTSDVNAYNVAVGWQAGYALTTGGFNTFLGTQAGSAITTGQKNVIFGNYGGNSGGLDIRTSSNYIVLSDGDGNIQFSSSTSGTPYFSLNGTSADGQLGTTVTKTTLSANLNDGIRVNQIGTSYWNGPVGTIVQFRANGSGTGTITQTSSITAYNATSDYRLKENVAPMTGALDKVALLKPCTYKWKLDGADGQGFIAHELQEVVPDCVTGAKDAVDAEGNPVYQGIDTSFLVATLTAAIQELKAELDTVKAELAALKG